MQCADSNEGAYHIAHRVLVPHCPGQQMLEPAGAGVSDRLRQCSAVRGHTRHQQCTHIRLRVRAQVMPGEDGRGQRGELREPLLEPSRSSGRAGRSLIEFRHTMMITERPARLPASRATHRADNLCSSMARIERQPTKSACASRRIAPYSSSFEEGMGTTPASRDHDPQRGLPAVSQAM